MPFTHRPIIVGIDGSKNSLNALHWAVREAVVRSAPLKLMTWPYDVSASLAFYSVPQNYYAHVKKSAEDTLTAGSEIAESLASDLGTRLEITTHLESGPVRPGILEASSSAQMVVVGSRGHGIVMSEILGSVASALVEHSRTSIVVVPEGSADAVRRVTGAVVVGVDGSDPSVAATATAFEEASLRRVELVAVHGYYSHTPRFDDGYVLSWPEVKKSEELALASAVEAYHGRYPDVALVTKVSAAGAVESLRNASETAALLVVGSRGRGGFAGLLLGSTSRALLHSVDCPVMVVHAD